MEGHLSKSRKPLPILSDVLPLFLEPNAGQLLDWERELICLKWPTWKQILLTLFLIVVHIRLTFQRILNMLSFRQPFQVSFRSKTGDWIIKEWKKDEHFFFSWSSSFVLVQFLLIVEQYRGYRVFQGGRLHKEKYSAVNLAAHVSPIMLICKKKKISWRWLWLIPNQNDGQQGHNNTN